MKKILTLGLIILSLFNIVNSMEEQISENALEEKCYSIELNLGYFEKLPDEIRHYIIVLLLEDHINNWNDIFNLDLKAILDQIMLISKDFNPFKFNAKNPNSFEENELQKLVTNLKEKKPTSLEEIKDQYKNFSIEELNQKLIDLLDESDTRKNMAEAVGLIIAGANANIQDSYGRTTLMLAIKDGYTGKIIRILIENNTDLNIEDEHCHTALELAIDKDNIKIVNLLIQNGANINTRQNDHWNPLISAIENGHVQIAKLLIENDAKINITGQHGWTALMYATKNNFKEIVALLIKNGAKINIQDHYYHSSALIYAAKYGHTEIAKLLIGNQANLNIQNYNGWTALMYAILGHIEIVKLLIEHGANLNIKDLLGRTALSFATEKGYTEIAELLKSNGAK